jgi:pyridoxine 5-phosphate synthase
MIRLLVNIDHVATLRNARGEGVPDPVEAARVCEDSGAEGIVFHLREDRRHIKDHDVHRLKTTVRGTLDFEMAATDEMLGIAREIQPHLCTLVPEKRAELTTEGGLDVVKMFENLRKTAVPALHSKNIEISLFVDPVDDQIRAASELGAEIVELHTGTFAHAWLRGDCTKELDDLARAAEIGHSLGLKINAGHGLSHKNIFPLLEAVPHLADISIGHALITDALYRGLPASVKAFADIFNSYNARSGNASQ